MISPCHQNLLVFIQLVIELDEGYKMREMILNSHQMQHNMRMDANDNFLTNIMPHILSTASTWREKLPNKNEDLTVW